MITVADIRKAIKGLKGTVPLNFQIMNDPPAGTSVEFGSIRADKHRLLIKGEVTIDEDDEDEEEEQCELCQNDYTPDGDSWDGFCPECADQVSGLMDFLAISRDEAKDILDNHDNWYHEGVDGESGPDEDLYRFDMPEVQVQLFIGVKEGDADPLERNDKYRYLIEHDVRDANDKRTKYSCQGWEIDKAEAVKLLTMRDAAEIKKHLAEKIEHVKNLPDDPAMH